MSTNFHDASHDGIAIIFRCRTMRLCQVIMFSFFTVLMSAVPRLDISDPRDAFEPASEWHDNHGVRINAHGGGVIFFKDRYYWFGEHKLANRSESQGADGGVHCYSSADLYNWKDEGVVLAVDTANPASDIAMGCILERPKVLFNASTQTFVMFFKLYLAGSGYDTGFVGVATAVSPTGPYTYRHKFLGGGSSKGSGDFAMVTDAEGAVHHLTVRKPDKVFVAGRLRPDLLLPEGPYLPVEGIDPHTEAPTVFRIRDTYYLIGSGSSSWKPNAARSFVASSPEGPYRAAGNPARGVNSRNGLGPEQTFGGQISFLLPVQSKPGAFIAMFDIWKPEQPINGGYMWLPVTIEAGRPVIVWSDRWVLSSFGTR